MDVRQDLEATTQLMTATDYACVPDEAEWGRRGWLGRLTRLPSPRVDADSRDRTPRRDVAA